LKINYKQNMILPGIDRLFAGCSAHGQPRHLPRLGDERVQEAGVRPVRQICIVSSFTQLPLYSISYQCRAQSLQHIPPDQMPPQCLDFVCQMNGIIFGEAHSCDCDLTGSISGICNPQGGQCECKPNVVGRRWANNNLGCWLKTMPPIPSCFQL
jgi:hypothetical protein